MLFHYRIDDWGVIYTVMEEHKSITLYIANVHIKIGSMRDSNWRTTGLVSDVLPTWLPMKLRFYRERGVDLNYRHGGVRKKARENSNNKKSPSHAQKPTTLWQWIKICCDATQLKKRPKNTSIFFFSMDTLYKNFNENRFRNSLY